MELEEKVDNHLTFVSIGDVSFVVFTKDWNWIKQKIKNKETFSFYSISNKRIDVIVDAVSENMEIVDTYKKTISKINYSINNN